jgi:hypothetical protein
MKKVLIITRCDDCCFFDNEYYGYNEKCRRLDRKITSLNGDYEIPTDCPLDDLDED